MEAVSVSFDDFAIFVNEELLEVPLDISSIVGGSQIVEGLEGIGTVDLNFLHHWEFNSVFCNKVQNIFWSSWFLSTKLVAWESQDLKTLIFVFIVDLN